MDRLCAHCGETAAATAKFCGKCGQPFDEQPASQATGPSSIGRDLTMIDERPASLATAARIALGLLGALSIVMGIIMIVAAGEESYRMAARGQSLLVYGVAGGLAGLFFVTLGRIHGTLLDILSVLKRSEK